MPTVHVFRARVALSLPRAEAMLVAFVLRVIQRMTGNADFASPGTVVSDLAAAVGAYQAALQNMGTAKNVSDARTAAQQAVKDALLHVKDYVNGVAEKLAPDQALATIESAGLRAKKRSAYAKPPLAIKYGGLAGSVLMIARAAAKNAMYFFEFSTDETNWQACPSLMKSKAPLSGLTVGTTYYFRFHAQTRKGLTPLSGVVSFVVR